jgi:hypothetical protein
MLRKVAKGLARNRSFVKFAQIANEASLRDRPSILSEGAVFGNREFVEGVFDSNRESGSQSMKGGAWRELRVSRDLRLRH